MRRCWTGCSAPACRHRRRRARAPRCAAQGGAGPARDGAGAGGETQGGGVGDVTALNRVLALGNSYGELVWSKRQGPGFEQRRRVGSVESLLVPVAEALASLLAQGDFELVRKCESSDCTLWFHDHTKSHRRRWCSMAQCGNRMKVAAFRARQKAE